MDYLIKELAQDFRITVVERELDLTFQKQVEAIWENQGLFDGKILSALEVSDDGMVASFVPYSYFFAAERDAALKEALGIQAVAVTGMTRNDAGRWLLGQRSNDVTQYPLCWELAPSGGLDEASVKEGIVDFRGQLLRELHEETGIDQVESISPKFLVQDQLCNMWELCLDVVVGGEPQCQSDEYQKLQWVDKGGLPSGDFVPLTHLLFNKMSF